MAPENAKFQIVTKLVINGASAQFYSTEKPEIKEVGKVIVFTDLTTGGKIVLIKSEVAIIEITDKNRDQQVAFRKD